LCTSRVALSATRVGMGDVKAKTVALNLVLAAVCPSKGGCLALTCPSAWVDGAVGIIAPEVGGLALVLHYHDERALFWRIDLPGASEKFVLTFCVGA